MLDRKTELPAELSCQQAGPNSVASSVCSQAGMGSGARHLKLPVGGTA